MIEQSRVNHALFRPYQFAHIEFSSRIVMAPMTRSHAPEGILGEENAAYYRRRTEAGVGLIISEGTWIDHPVASDRTSAPRFYGDDALAGWRRVADAVHSAGGKIMPQLWHVGAGAERSQGWNPTLAPASPSGIVLHAAPTPPAKALTDREIAECVDDYARAAADAYALGFDGIELHAAHGYLIDQFFWHNTNHREDGYNGGVAGRTRFGAEIVRECRRRTAPSFPISLRFSQWKSSNYEAKLVENPAELASFLEPLADAGVDIFHCSTRRYWQPAFDGSALSLAGWTKKLSGKTTIAVGSVGLDKAHETRRVEEQTGYSAKSAPIDQLIEMMERDEFDLIAIGRALLVNYDWPRKVRMGAWDELKPYSTAVRNTLY